MTVLREQPKERVKFQCPFCKFKLYPTHEEHLWVSKSVMGRHLAQLHRNSMDAALREIYRTDEMAPTHGFRRGL